MTVVFAAYAARTLAVLVAVLAVTGAVLTAGARTRATGG